MKSVALILFPVAFVSLVACNNGRAYNPDTKIESSQAGQANLPAQQAGATTTGTNPEVATAPTTPVTGASAKINPAHGQPGHRCDIAVGAPIPPTVNQPAAGNQPVTTVNAPLNIAPLQTGQATAQPVATAPAPPPATGKGLNPAHGQPGHRCDIAVGAPLDSKPVSAPAVTTPVTTQPGSITSVPKPVAVNPAPVPQKVAPGMNPAHGQPGHRCDIAEGAPLNSKPVSPPTVSPVQPMPITPLMPPVKDSTKN